MTTYDLPDLDDVLLGQEPDYDETEVADIDLATADRYLRRIVHLDDAYEADATIVNEQIAQLERWKAHRYEAYMSQRGWLSARLQRFHEAALSLDPRSKTIRLPAGELRMRAQQDALSIDGEQFIPWAKEHRPDTLREVPATYAVDVRTVRSALVNGFVVDADGEVAPGVTVEPREPKFSIEVGTEDEPLDQTLHLDGCPGDHTGACEPF